MNDKTMKTEIDSTKLHAGPEFPTAILLLYELSENFIKLI